MKPAIIDCRNFIQYQQSHHRDACHIAADDLFQRMHELPQKGSDIVLIIDKETQACAEAFFAEKDYTINETWHWTPELTQILSDQGLLATGATSTRYWQPSSIVKQFCHDHLAELPKQAKVLDIAAGAGRDAVYLALHDLDVTILDYNADAIKRSESLAQVNQVSIEAHSIDLEKNSHSLQQFTDNSFDVIVVCRYLHRPLFTEIRRLIKPCGFILYHTFIVGSEKIGSPRNPNFLLQENELAEIFNGFNIINNDIEYLADGRPTSFFIAQKPKR